MLYRLPANSRARKTGITLPDTGIRDENGLEPMDGLFSSPEKPKNRSAQKVNGARKNANATISNEEDMDVGDSM
jgi:centromere protein C